MTRRSTFLMRLREEVRSTFFTLLFILLIPAFHGLAQAHAQETSSKSNICSAFDADASVPGGAPAGHDCTRCVTLNCEPPLNVTFDAPAVVFFKPVYVPLGAAPDRRLACIIPPSHAPPAFA